MNFSIVDPTNGNAPYNILTAAAFAGTDPGTGMPVCADDTARLAIDIAWDTSDYTNWGSGTTPAAWGQPISLNPLAGCGTATPAVGTVRARFDGGVYHDFADPAAESARRQVPAGESPRPAPPSPTSAW